MSKSNIFRLPPVNSLRFRPNGSVRIGELMARAGLDLLPKSDAELSTTCPECGRTQSLAEAEFGPGRRHGDLGVYRCAQGCGAVLIAIAYPGRKSPHDLSAVELDDVELTVRGVGGLCFRSIAHGNPAPADRETVAT